MSKKRDARMVAENETHGLPAHPGDHGSRYYITDSIWQHYAARGDEDLQEFMTFVDEARYDRDNPRERVPGPDLRSAAIAILVIVAVLFAALIFINV